MTITHRDNALDAEVALLLHCHNQRRWAALTRIIGIVLMVLGTVLLASLVITGRLTCPRT
jgi:hypothetical protein